MGCIEEEILEKDKGEATEQSKAIDPEYKLTRRNSAERHSNEKKLD